MATTLSHDNLKKHLSEEHQISPMQTYLKEIVYGGTDGIVTTFAVVAGFAGAQAGGSIAAYSIITVLLFGLANLFADGASMGLGNFLSLRAEKDVYKAAQEKELYEIRTHPKSEMTETVSILIDKGFTQTDAETITTLYSKNESYWLRFMMNDELEMPNPEKENPFLTGFATFGAFVAFGFIPLIPYILFQSKANIFIISCVSAFLALVLLGLLRWRVTKESLIRSTSEIVLIGSVAASIAYIVGTFFRM